MAVLGAGAPALPLETPRAPAEWDEDEPEAADVRTGAGELTGGAGTLATTRSLAGAEVLRPFVATLACRTGDELRRAGALEAAERPAAALAARRRWLAAAPWEARDL